jgi:hypothetical protein
MMARASMITMIIVMMVAMATMAMAGTMRIAAPKGLP